VAITNAYKTKPTAGKIMGIIFGSSKGDVPEATLDTHATRPPNTTVNIEKNFLPLIHIALASALKYSHIGKSISFQCGYNRKSMASQPPKYSTTDLRGDSKQPGKNSTTSRNQSNITCNGSKIFFLNTMARSATSDIIFH